MRIQMHSYSFCCRAPCCCWCTQRILKWPLKASPFAVLIVKIWKYGPLVESQWVLQNWKIVLDIALLQMRNGISCTFRLIQNWMWNLMLMQQNDRPRRGLTMRHIINLNRMTLHFLLKWRSNFSHECQHTNFHSRSSTFIFLYIFSWYLVPYMWEKWGRTGGGWRGRRQEECQGTIYHFPREVSRIALFS